MQRTCISQYLISIALLIVLCITYGELRKETLASFGCSVSLLLPQCSTPVRTLVEDLELQKKDPAHVTRAWDL